MIVVDTSVLMPLYLPHQHSEASRSLLRSDPDWLAPLLWRSEAANVLWKQVRLRGMDPAVALDVFQACKALLIGKETATGHDDVLMLACRAGCSGYDAEFVALAQRKGLRLATRDRALLRLFPDSAFCPE